MFPSYVASASNGSTSSPTSFSVGLGDIGTNRLLIIGVTGIYSSSGTVTSVTVGGISASFENLDTANYGGAYSRGHLYYLKEASFPAGSSATVSINWTGFDAVIGGAILFQSVDQSADLNSDTFTQNSNAVDISNSHSFTPDKMLVDVLSMYENASGNTADGGQTERVDYDQSSNQGNLSMSHKEGSSSPDTMGWSWNNRHRCQVQIIAELNFEAPATGNAIFFGANT